MPKLLKHILAQSSVKFGTSGARGLVTDFTDEVCAAYTQSFCEAIRHKFDFTGFAVAVDNRPSSNKMAAACIGILRALGLKVEYYGVLPTPALAYNAMLDKVPAIMITGSHIPFDRNGIKFYRPDGEITKEDEQVILAIDQPLLAFKPELPTPTPHAAEAYLERYLSFFPENMLADKHVGIYEHSSAGRDLYYRVFEALGAKVTRLERSNTFVPIDTEAVSLEDKRKGLNWARQYNFDVIFSSDGDGDRPLISDENGDWFRGDIAGLLCAKALKINALAVPVSCNTAIEKSEFFNKVIRTRIGSPYVIAAFSELKTEQSFAGFEANGGFLLGSDISVAGKTLKSLPTRDALLPALAILGLSAEQPISKLLSNLPPRFTASDRLQNASTVWSQDFIVSATQNPEKLIRDFGLTGLVVAVDTIDGLRIELNNEDVVHLRPSGNSPELRCYVECSSVKNANLILNSVLGKLRNMHDNQE